MSMMTDVLIWARETGQPRDAIYELLKVPARLGLHDDDLSHVPADLDHFESVIAPSSYAAVSKSANAGAAARRGNARLRALLTRFHGGDSVAGRVYQVAGWDHLMDHIRDNAGHEPGKMFKPEYDRRLLVFRARSGVEPPQMTDAVVARVAADMPAGKREWVRRGVAAMNRLIADRNAQPGIRHLLPSAPLTPPAPVDRRPAIFRNTLAPTFRASVEALFSRTLATPEHQAAKVRERAAAGEDPVALIAVFNAERTRTVTNSTTATEGYWRAITWLLGALQAEGRDPMTVASVDEVLQPDVLRRAVDWQIARAARSMAMKNPDRSSTITAYLTNIATLARHGTADMRLLLEIEILRRERGAFIRTPGEDGMVPEIEAFCQMIQESSAAAARLVRAPQLIAAQADVLLAAAAGGERRYAEIEGLRLHAAAAAFACQMSRPVRPLNLLTARLAETPKAPATVRRLRDGGINLRFPRGEVKNDAAVTVPLRGEDAAIFRAWIDIHRPRYMTLLGITESPYVWPGKAAPEGVKDRLRLPHGCQSDRTFARMWADGAEIVGIRLTPHMARHAVATLILAREPGNFAKAASVLGDTEQVVRNHYGCDSGMAASTVLRAALLKEHPDLLKSLKRAA